MTTDQHDCHQAPELHAPEPGFPEDLQARTHSTHGYDKDALRKRMNRIAGQVGGINRMIEQDTYCIDVLTQISAVTAALHAVGVNLLEDHMKHCVVDAAKQSDEAAAAKIAEATSAIQRLIKS